MQIRRAVPGDFLAIAALDREAWKRGDNAEFIPDGEHAWRIWIEHAVVFCAEDASRILGAVLAFPATNGSYCLHKVFVDEECRGEGIGSQLFDELLQRMDELEVAVFLTVSPANDAAIALYEKWGFTERTFVKGYYRESEDRFVLTRRWSHETAASRDRSLRPGESDQGA